MSAGGFRPIKATKFEQCPRPLDFGPASQLMWLPIASLVVDDAYQRPIAAQGEKTVRAIIAKFDWRMFAPVVVSPIAGGLYAIVDGQHRTTAALACGHAMVPCSVVMADRQAQAAAFGAINGVVTKVSTHQQWKAALAASSPEALRIKAAADAAGIRILFHNRSTLNLAARETVALEAIRQAIVRHGDAVTVEALKAISASAGEMPGVFRAAIVRAVVEVLADHREWVGHPSLHAAFEQIDLDEVRMETYAQAARKRGLVGQDLLQAAIVSHLFEKFERVAA